MCVIIIIGRLCKRMNYKGFDINYSKHYIIIKNIDGHKVYFSEIYSDNENEVYEIGKKIIDLAMEIKNEKKETDYLAFQSIYRLNEQNEVRRYARNEKGIEKKEQYRKQFRNNSYLLLLLDTIIILSGVFVYFFINKDLSIFITNLIFLVIIELLGIMNCIMSSLKKDYYGLNKKTKIIADATAIASNAPLGGVGNAIVAGPAIRYVVPQMIMRLLYIGIIFFSLFEGEEIVYLFIIIFIEIILSYLSYKNYCIVKKYNRINEDGVDDFISPRIDQ